jgi:hypothetical protein
MGINIEYDVWLPLGGVAIGVFVVVAIVVGVTLSVGVAISGD